ncbi:MAG: hypothetical protein JNM27_03485 [Leptospirales bacterium]|nr:hypothetical protein [Leptospirales bacterium]
MIDKLISFATDTATLALFDPELLAHRINDAAPDWWTYKFAELPEVIEGRLLLLDLGSDGAYQVRITNQELAANEKAYARNKLGPFALKVKSGELFTGAGEEVPGAGLGIETLSSCFPILAGDYAVTVYWIDRASNGYWSGTENKSSDVPVDIVIQIELSTSKLNPPTEEQLQLISSGDFLFPDLPRHVGPLPGMLISSQVRKSNGSLVLAEAGPLHYRPLLETFDGLTQGQRVRVEVLDVDHSNRTFRARIVSYTQ